MQNFITAHVFSLLTTCITLIAVLTGALIYQNNVLTALRDAHRTSASQLEVAKASLSEKEIIITGYTNNLNELKTAFALSEENGSELLSLLTAEKNKNEVFEEQIGDISGTVGKLDKLSKIDPELLMKYSKVYFLNEHYAPEKISEIPQTFRFKTEEPEYIGARVAPFLTDMLENARDDGVELLVVSGYRSFDEQKSLKGAYAVQYGSGANAFSADQGYSEHQLGTTIDLTTTAVGGGLAGFQNTEAYTWLQENAHKYGFVLSYPKDNGYYIFEPWHWRFVGEDLARNLHRNGKFFYDLEQREIDEYLISVFD
jgi:D-alanyl-D-alanine carboxypeptidase